MYLSACLWIPVIYMFVGLQQLD